MSNGNESQGNTGVPHMVTVHQNLHHAHEEQGRRQAPLVDKVFFLEELVSTVTLSPIKFPHFMYLQVTSEIAQTPLTAHVTTVQTS